MGIYAECRNCNFYNYSERICVKDGKFYFEDMPPCNDFKYDYDIDLKAD